MPAAPAPVPARRPEAADEPTQAMRPADPRPQTRAAARERPEHPEPAAARRVRRTRLVVRKIDPWSVLKFSLVFYACVMLILLFATAVIFAVMQVLGVIENIEQLFRSLEFDVSIGGGAIFKWGILLGILGTIVATAVTVLMAFLYNLIADVIGGVEISVSEPE